MIYDNTPTASYERNILTLDFPNAAQPVLWRREIGDVNQLSFTLAQDGNRHALIYQPAGDVEWQTIATFEDRDNAQTALHSVRAALFQPRGRQHVKAKNDAGARPGWVRGTVKWTLLAINGLLVLLGLFVVISAGINLMRMHHGAAPVGLPQTQTQAPAVDSQTAPAEQATEMPDGQPLPADQFLSPPITLSPQPVK